MIGPAEKIFSFDDFELNCAKRQLLKGGDPVTLNSRTFDLLSILVRSHGQILSKDVLLGTVWEGQFVEENNLTVQISTLRKILGERRDTKQFIATVPGKGYSFVADVVPLNGDREITIENKTISRIVVEEFGPSEADSGPLMLGNGSRRRFGTGAVVFGMIIVGLIVGLGIYVVQQRLESDRGAFREVTTLRLTNVGNVRNAALSPDGKLYVYSAGLRQSLRLGQTRGGEEIELIPSSDATYRSLVFSPDGGTIYYVSTGKDHPNGGLYRIRSTGGLAEKLRENIRTNVAFSPDMNHFAYVGRTAGSDNSSLFIADTNGTKKREVAVRPNKLQFEPGVVAWSKDGTTIAVAAISDKAEGINCEVFLVGAEGGEIRQLTDQKFRGINGIAWLSDGSGLTVAAAQNTKVNSQLWYVSAGDGSVRQINSSLTNFGSALSVSLDNGSMLAVTSDSITNIWIAPADAPEGAKQITTTAFGGAFARVGISWLPDRRIVMSGHDKTGGSPLWIANSDGTDLKQLTPDGSIDTNPSGTADGRYIVFGSNRSGALEIWRIDLVSNELTQLTSGGYNYQPSVSPDGNWVVYISGIDGVDTIWRVPLSGGNAEKIGSRTASWVRVSPDSRFIACGYNFDSKTRIAILSIDGGEPIKGFDLAAGGNLRYALRWAPDGKSLTYRDWDYGYWRQSIDGGEPQRLAGFPEEKLFSYDWSPDGKQIAFGRGIEIRDIILIRNAK